MRRRDFIALLGGAAAWPLAARGQQGERARRIGVLVSGAETDPETQARLVGFRDGLQRLGWSEGRNVRVEQRFGAASAEQGRLSAKDYHHANATC